MLTRKTKTLHSLKRAARAAGDTRPAKPATRAKAAGESPARRAHRLRTRALLTAATRPAG